jgi:glycosyltransferase involved in cell wall biosynthesis
MQRSGRFDPETGEGNEAMTQPFLSVVIPSFRGCRRLPPFLDELVDAIDGYPWDETVEVEILVVDDGSPRDEQQSVVRELAHRNPGGNNSVRVSFRSVCLPENRGQQYATILGVAAAGGNLIATVDDDGAHPPAELLKMVRYMQNHPATDLIYGAPCRDDRSVRRLGTVMNNVLFSLFLGKPRDVAVTSFRVIRHRLVRCAVDRPVSFPYLSAMLFSCGPVTAVHRYHPPGGTIGRIVRPGRREGRATTSRYTLKELFRIYWNLVLFWGPLRWVGRIIRPPRRVVIPRGCD